MNVNLTLKIGFVAFYEDFSPSHFVSCSGLLMFFSAGIPSGSLSTALDLHK